MAKHKKVTIRINGHYLPISIMYGNNLIETWRLMNCRFAVNEWQTF